MVTLTDVLKKKPTDHKQTENHSLSFFVLFIIKEGEGVHTVNYLEHTYRRGTVFALREGTTHKFTKSNSEGYLLVFTKDFIIKHLVQKERAKSLQLFNELIESPKIQLSESIVIEVEIIIEQLIIEIESGNDTYSSSIKRSLLHVLITKLFREKTRNSLAYVNSKYLNKFLEFQTLIEVQWMKNRTVIDYANQLAVTPKTLNNIVKKTIKKSAKSLIDDIVITQIKHFLVNTELSITEIAYKSGFEDPTNFFKYFKKNTFYSPNQFRIKNK